MPFKCRSGILPLQKRGWKPLLRLKTWEKRRSGILPLQSVAAYNLTWYYLNAYALHASSEVHARTDAEHGNACES